MLTKLRTTVHSNGVLYLFVRPLPGEYGFQEQALGGQEPGPERILQRVKIRHNLLTSQPKGLPFQPKGRIHLSAKMLI